MSAKTDLAVMTFDPIYDVPPEAPAPPMDLANPHLSFDDVLPSNYFSMEDLQIWLEEREAVSRVLTVSRCNVEYVYDPEKGVETGSWKPCLHFHETTTTLVINKSRGQQLKKLAKSPLLAEWGKVGRIAIKPGIANSKAQIVIEPVVEDKPAKKGKGKSDLSGKTDEELNEDLFG